MKLTVRANEYRNENNPGLAGFASLNFDDKYVLEQVAIYQKKSGDYYIKLPSISVKIKDENGNFIEGPDGNYKKGSKEIFHPSSVDARNMLTAEIVHAIRDNPGEKCVNNNFMGDFVPNTSRIYPSTNERNNNQVGFGSVSFGDFVLENVSLNKMKDSDDYAVSSTSRQTKVKDKETGEWKSGYSEYFHAITTEAYNELKEEVVASYNANLANGKGKTAVDSKSAEQSASVSPDAFDVGELDMTDFEDVLDVTEQNKGTSR